MRSLWEEFRQWKKHDQNIASKKFFNEFFFQNKENLSLELRSSTLDSRGLMLFIKIDKIDKIGKANFCVIRMND